MLIERCEQRRFVNAQRLSVVKMATWPVLSCAAGMKNSRAIMRREAAQFEILESGGRHCRNLPPVTKPGAFNYSFRLAEPSVGLIVLALERKQPSREPSKDFIRPGAFCLGCGLNQVTKVTRKFGKCGDGSHAVFILPGWFSATARDGYLTEVMNYGK